MNETALANSQDRPRVPEGFVMRRVFSPIRDQLTQGLSPDQIALTIAVGVALASIPVIGVTTVLCGLAAYLLRLNQPIMQAVNFTSYPLQLGLLIPYIRLGELLFGSPRLPLSIAELTERFRGSLLLAIDSLWTVTWQAVIAWLLVSIPLSILHYFVLRAVLRALSRRLGVRRLAVEVTPVS